MKQEQEAPELISVGAQTLVDTANRLGLTWRLRLATVTEASLIDRVPVRLDGDSDFITATSMVGPCALGARVYVLSIPPAGNYIAGFTQSNFLAHSAAVQLTASTTASTTYANLTNVAGVAFTAPGSGTVTILYTSRLGTNSASGGAAITPWIGTGSTVGAGTEILAASDARMLLYLASTASEDQRWGGHHTQTGLNPGQLYNVSMRGRAVTTGTATFDDIATTVIPSP